MLARQYGPVWLRKQDKKEQGQLRWWPCSGGSGSALSGRLTVIVYTIPVLPMESRFILKS
jgi:hypothetical protein